MSEAEFEDENDVNSPDIVDNEGVNSELETFESRISATATDPEDTEKIEYSIEKEVPESGRRPSKKDALVSSILKFKGHLPELVPTHNRLKKTKIGDLERLLARCIATASGLQMKKEFTEPRQNPLPSAFASQPTSALPIPNTAKSGAKTLYMANIGLVSVIEQLSKQTQEYTGVVIEGWSDDIKNDKEQLMMILEGVYAENTEVVNNYMSPTSVYCLYMLSSGAGHLKGATPRSLDE